MYLPIITAGAYHNFLPCTETQEIKYRSCLISLIYFFLLRPPLNIILVSAFRLEVLETKNFARETLDKKSPSKIWKNGEILSSLLEKLNNPGK